MDPMIYLLTYLVIAIIIMVIFDIEPIGAVLFPLFPIIIIKELFLKYKNKKIIIESEQKRITPIPSFKEFID